jgi:hypothetical protein
MKGLYGSKAHRGLSVGQSHGRDVPIHPLGRRALPFGPCPWWPPTKGMTLVHGNYEPGRSGGPHPPPHSHLKT